MRRRARRSADPEATWWLAGLVKADGAVRTMLVALIRHLDTSSKSLGSGTPGDARRRSIGPKLAPSQRLSMGEGNVSSRSFHVAAAASSGRWVSYASIALIAPHSQHDR